MAPAASADEVKMYHRMADWYNSPECDALRAAWGPYPATPGALQAWPGFVAVTNAFLDYEAAHGRRGDERSVTAATEEPVAAEAESEPVGASDVRPAESAASTKPVVASEVMEREASVESGGGAHAEASEPETEQAAGEAVGSVEFLGRWKSRHQYETNSSASAMPTKMKGRGETGARVAFGKLVDELVQTNVSSGILVISKTWGSRKFSWSASPDDKSYQLYGFVGMESDHLDRGQNVRYRDAEGSVSQINGDTYDITLRVVQADGSHIVQVVQAARDQLEPIHQRVAFADFEGVVADFGSREQKQMAVYRVTLPSGGLDPDKWAGRAPPLAPEELYTGPRSDGLLSTDEISGEYTGTCICDGFPTICNCWSVDDPDFQFCKSMTVVPLGADTIETRSSSCCFLPCLALAVGPIAEGCVLTRKPGTNEFEYSGFGFHSAKFKANGTFKWHSGNTNSFKKRPHSQKRAFQKVDAKDLAGTWCGCYCFPAVPLWPFSPVFCTTKKALNEDQYAESICGCCLCLPFPYCGGTHTRKYVNGHPTNAFDDGMLYRDPRCAISGSGASDPDFFFSKKCCC